MSLSNFGESTRFITTVPTPSMPEELERLDSKYMARIRQFFSALVKRFSDWVAGVTVAFGAGLFCGVKTSVMVKPAGRTLEQAVRRSKA